MKRKLTEKTATARLIADLEFERGFTSMLTDVLQNRNREIDALKRDIERYVQISSDLATEMHEFKRKKKA